MRQRVGPQRSDPLLVLPPIPEASVHRATTPILGGWSICPPGCSARPSPLALFARLGAHGLV